MTANGRRIREFIVENFLFGDGGRLAEGTSFLDEGIIDSTGILELVNFLEEEFGVKIPDDELVPENLDSIWNIEQYLRRKLGMTEPESDLPAAGVVGA